MVFEKIALQAPHILLPRNGIDLNRWAVIACDQYTSQPEYWDKVARHIGDAPSTLELIFPEVYLEDDDGELRVQRINAAMRRYLDEKILLDQGAGFILVDRATTQVPSRKGLMVALDLEQYDYNAGATTLIRATEGTIVDRLPPRIKVRENAPIELPHIMVLIDDPQLTVIEPLFAKELEEVYDVELMADGGRVRGWRVSAAADIEQVAARLAALATPAAFNARYGVSDKPVMLYAMGDGNHSFATAKAIWERLKAQVSDLAAIMNHPARYALVELVNVHDPGLEFEAIHRVLFNVDGNDLLAAMERYYADRCEDFALRQVADVQKELALPPSAGVHRIPFVIGAQQGVIEISAPRFNLVVATLQGFLDVYLPATKARIDYIHGDETVAELGGKTGNAGFWLPAISKHELFKTIVLDGALPRKTFSMGEADEKRFYLECRAIVCGGESVDIDQ
ncbi:MAG: DUF1015 domain-containing protein [Desulfuromonadaceae bacterium]|nr:DUF1015 domain-containing protein [Desulfuromonadaceae bacterium]